MQKCNLDIKNMSSSSIMDNVILVQLISILILIQHLIMMSE